MTTTTLTTLLSNAIEATCSGTIHEEDLPAIAAWLDREGVGVVGRTVSDSASSFESAETITEQNP